MLKRLGNECARTGRLIFVLATLLLPSCGGRGAADLAGDDASQDDKPGSAVFDSGVDAFSFPAAYAISLGVPGSVGAIQILISNTASRCDLLKTTFFESGMLSLDLYVFPPVSSTEAGVVIAPLVVPPGTYTIGDQEAEFGVLAALHVLDSECHDVGYASPSSGTLTLTATNPRISGAFDFTFDQGRRLVGSFDAAPCLVSSDSSQVLCTITP